MTEEQWHVHFPDNLSNNRMFNHSVVYPTQARAEAAAEQLRKKHGVEFPVTSSQEEQQRKDAELKASRPSLKDGCDHRWSDPDINAPPVTCLKCGAPKVYHIDNRIDQVATLPGEGGELLEFLRNLIGENRHEGSSWTGVRLERLEEIVAALEQLPSPTQGIEGLVGRLRLMSIEICGEAAAALETQQFLYRGQMDLNRALQAQRDAAQERITELENQLETAKNNYNALKGNQNQ